MSEGGDAGGEAPGSVRRSLAWASIGQLGFFVLQFGSSVILAHLLSPREMGVFAIGAATVALVSALQALGLNNFLIRADRLDRHVLATVFTVNILLSGAVSLGIVGLGFFSARLFAEPGTVRVMLWLAATPVITALGLLPSSLLQRENNFRALSVIRIVATLFGNATTVALALAGWSYMSLAYGWVLTCALNSAAACLLAPRHVSVRLGLRGWREVSSFGMGMLLVNGVTQAQRQLLNLILGRAQGLAAVGLWSRANNLFSLLVDNTQTVAMRVFLVDFASANRRGQQLGQRYTAVVEGMTALLWPLFGGLAVVSGPCIRLLYGPMWTSLALPLSLLCLSGVVWISISMAWEIFVVANETGRQARIEMWRAGIGTALFAAGCWVSLNVAVATRIGETVACLFLYGPHIRRITGVRTRDLLPIYARSGGLALVAVAPAAAVMAAHGWSATTPLAPVFGAIAGGIAAWAVALALVGHPLFRQAAAVAARRAHPGLAATPAAG